MPKVLTFANLGRMMYLRSIGLTQKEIAKELGVTQEAISYNLRKMKKRVTSEGPLAPFMMYLAGATDAGVGNLAEYFFGRGARLYPCPECGRPIIYKTSKCAWCGSQTTEQDWIEGGNK